MFWFYASARKIEIKKSDILVSDSINVYPCKFQFSADWHDLTKTAVFRAGSTAIEILLDENLECNIPWEVLLKDKLDLFVGCYGTKGEDIILNTTWTNIGKIYEGTKNKAVPGEDPTPDIYTQITSSIGDLSQLETSDKSSLVNAINEVKNSIGSGVGPDGPLPAGVASFNGRTGSVLPQSGDYTAEMVGATPAADFEIFRENTEEDIDRIASDTADKIDKSGGTVTGPIIFSDSASAMSYTYEDESVAEEKQGVVVSSTGILKNSPGTMNISCMSKEVAFDDGTKLTGVVGDEDSPTSVPNVSQVKEYIQSAVENIEGGEGVVGPEGPPGKDGFSPTVSTSINEEKDGVNVTITDINGDHTFTILNGIDGEDGPPGPPGSGADLTAGDGISIEGDTISVTTPVRGVLSKSEYDALPENERMGLFAITEDGAAGGTSMEVYSTEETRIGTWVDGKPLYQKTAKVEVGLANASPIYTRLVDSGIIDIGWVDSCFSFSDMTSHPLNFYYGTSHFLYCYLYDGSVVASAKDAKLIGTDAYATIKYTKTTD